MRIAREKLRSMVKVVVEKNGLPPSTEVLAKWLHVSVQRLYYMGNLRELLKECDVYYDYLPASASKFERCLYAILRVHFAADDIVFQKKFSECRTTKALPFDFYIRSLNMIVEADGAQHYATGKPEWHMCKNTDEFKNNFCKEHGISMLRVRHRRFEWNKDKLHKALTTIQLQAQETGSANCFNCWDGEALLPISSQAFIKIKPKARVEVHYETNCVHYSVYYNYVLQFTAYIDEKFYEQYLTVHSLYLRKGKLYLTSTGRLAANAVLGITSHGDVITKYKDDNPFNITKSNLYVIKNSELPRSRRVTKRSSTGIAGIHVAKGAVKGKEYATVYAISHKTGLKKGFGTTKIGFEEAIRRAKEWLNMQEGSQTK